MTTPSAPHDTPPPDSHVIRVLAPDARRLSLTEVRGMLGGARPHHPRGGGLERGRQMVAVRGGEPVGVAVFEIRDADLLVHLLAAAPAEQDEVVPALIGALELACLAGGGRRVAVTGHADVDVVSLGALGYSVGAARAGWIGRRLA